MMKETREQTTQRLRRVARHALDCTKCSMKVNALIVESNLLERWAIMGEIQDHESHQGLRRLRA